MAGSYQQFPTDGSGPGPGPLPPPPLPDAMRRAWLLMLAGAAVALVGDIIVALATHNSSFTFYSSTSTSDGTTTTTVHHTAVVLSGILGGVITALLWLWMAWKTRAARSWARVLSTVFFGISCLSLIGAAATASSRGPGGLVLDVVEWAIGLVALILLWRPESSQFFRAAQQARLGGGYYQPPQPPYYGPPQP